MIGVRLLFAAIEIRAFDVLLFDGSSAKLVVWFLITLVCLAGLFWATRIRPRADPDVAIMLVTLNVVVFVVAYFMSALSIGLGFAFGLFALFGIMRYRTVTISLRHMSYLFAAIALAVVNALGPKGLPLAEIVLMDAFIIAAIRVATGWRPPAAERSCTVEYDRVELADPARRSELIADLTQRTGLTVTSLNVRKISVATGLVTLNVTYLGADADTIDLIPYEDSDQMDSPNGEAVDVFVDGSPVEPGINPDGR